MNTMILLSVGWYDKSLSLKKIVRMVVSAMFLGGVELLLIIGIPVYRLYVIVSHAVILPLMVKVVWNTKKGRDYLRQLLRCLLISVFTGGVVMALENTFGIRRQNVFFGLLSFLCVAISLDYIHYRLRRHARFCKVRLYTEGREITCIGLWDSGNLLCDPIEGRPVHIVSQKVIRELFGIQALPVGRIVYESLGAYEKTMPLYRAKCMIMDKREQDGILLAAAGDSFFCGKEYQMIINTLDW